uniref:Transforming growth factor, alpha n=1 Tax=Sphaeramia orbicularis TaxID=375764 RepID=A0A672YPW7_9TELE
MAQWKKQNIKIEKGEPPVTFRDQNLNQTLFNRPLFHNPSEFVAAAVRSHFDDCPDSHSHFCFHGTCRFLILEETPACVCHQGFVGMRCEHADLLAVVATNHRQQTVATVLVLCVISCVLIMVCWWRQDCRRRRHIHHYASEKNCSALKHGASYCPSESG